MISETYILGKFHQHPAAEQVEILLKALDYMKTDSRRSRADCIAMAMGIPLFPKVIGIEDVEGYKVKIRFNNGEERLINFQTFLSEERRLEKLLLEDYDKFRTVEVKDGTLVWPAVGITSKDPDGNAVFDIFDVDPGLLYEYEYGEAGQIV